ncbi:MAG: ArsB/NhaD family transporter [bacterium]
MLKIRLFCGLVFILIFSLNAQADKVIMSGQVKNIYGEGIQFARLNLYVDGQPYPLKGELKTSKEGNFLIKLSPEKIKEGKIGIKITKPGYQPLFKEIQGEKVTPKGDIYYGYLETVLIRKFGVAFYLATTILIISFLFIAFDVVHRTLAAFIGAALMLFISYTIGTFNPDYFIISFEEAIASIDFNVIFLLMGMLIIVGIMKTTGIFQWMAYKSYQLSKGNIWYLVVILMVITGIISAFLDNVTTILLLAPVSIEIALVLGINPMALLIPEIFASNVGGTATLIGDPPNIIIGSYANLTFNDFIIHLTPVVIVAMVALIIMIKFYYGREFKKVEKIEEIEGLLKRLKEEYQITDVRLLTLSLFILGLVILLFVLHGILHMEVSIAAMIGASTLLLFSKVDIIKMIEEVEWTTLVFFMMLFIIIGGVQEVGLIHTITDMVKNLSSGNLIMAILLIIWITAFMSSIIDNIPFTATMLSVVAYLTKTIPGAENNVLWWALSLGACFGGNGSLIGASANVITIGILERYGHSVTFFYFLKIGLPVMIITTIIASLWLLLFT